MVIPSTELSTDAVKPQFPIVNLRDNSRVFHRDDPPCFCGRVNLATADSEAFDSLTCVGLVRN